MFRISISSGNLVYTIRKLLLRFSTGLKNTVDFIMVACIMICMLVIFLTSASDTFFHSIYHSVAVWCFVFPCWFNYLWKFFCCSRVRFSIVVLWAAFYTFYAFGNFPITAFKNSFCLILFCVFCTLIFLFSSFASKSFSRAFLHFSSQRMYI